MLFDHYTEKNIFNNKLFINWFKDIPFDDKEIILEPFAGKNNIISSLKDLKLINNYASYDINPQVSEVKKRDVLLKFPKHYKTIVTNPPYLSRSSASRQGITIKIDPYNDLYELCLAKCLTNAKYVAAIIPESFITSNFFKDRLQAVISLPQKKIFKQTEHPVCLALFGKKKTASFDIYRNENYLGNNIELQKKRDIFFDNLTYAHIHSNRSYGKIGLVAIDNCINDNSMRFCYPDEIMGNIDATSRLRTIFEVEGLSKIDKEFIDMCNIFLKEYREQTKDVFLTSFKSLRADGVYRRRIDFVTAKKLISKAYHNSFF